ncbi:hypothetical protein ES705_37792 [subsurface metagenome]
MATWTERQPKGAQNGNWETIGVGGDRSKLIIGEYGGRLYTSVDNGESWTERQPAEDFDREWYCVASSSDGLKLIAGLHNKRLYTSLDNGEIWTERQPDIYIGRQRGKLGRNSAQGRCKYSLARCGIQ